MKSLSVFQQKILNLLLDKYESSRSYFGENKRQQRFRIKAEEIWPAYTDDFTDVTKIEEFERQIRQMTESGLIETEETKLGTYRCFVAREERIPEYYVLLERQEKRELLEEELCMYQRYRDHTGVLGTYCREQLRLLAKGRKAEYRPERAKQYIALLKRIEENKEPLYERELSVQILYDTKAFEKSYRKTECNILRKYGFFVELPDDETEERILQTILLEHYKVYSNPGYLYFRGGAEIVCEDGNTMRICHAFPIAVSSELLERVSFIRVESEKILTIETLTSFHRFSDKSFFCIFLSGYHSVHKTGFLRKIKDPEKKSWYHFGDLDPDGFGILRNIRRKTGFDFRAYQMDIEVLERYVMYAKPLQEQDRAKARTMIAEGFYTEVLQYMLMHDVKLEQEIIGRG